MVGAHSRNAIDISAREVRMIAYCDRHQWPWVVAVFLLYALFGAPI
jgi:hypothetical protein